MAVGYSYIWEYRVVPGKVDDFQRAYGPDGDWVQLFTKAPGYLRTELHRDRSDSSRFVTIDYWESKSAWQAFRNLFADRFEALDARCASLTTRETEIGRFQPAG